MEMTERPDDVETVASPAPAGPEFALATQPSYLRTVFLGPEGLRAGWGLAFYVAMFLLLQRPVAGLAWSRDFGASGLWSMMLEELGDLLAAVIPAVVLMLVERRPWRVFGVPSRETFGRFFLGGGGGRVYGLPARETFGRLFWVGALWGFAGISLLMFGLYGLHGFAFGHLVLHGARLLRFAGFWAVMFLLVGLFEEFLL